MKFTGKVFVLASLLFAVAFSAPANAAQTVKLALPHGIHARPAARIGEAARGFQAELHLLNGDKRGDARSTVALPSATSSTANSARVWKLRYSQRRAASHL